MNTNLMAKMLGLPKCMIDQWSIHSDEAILLSRHGVVQPIRLK